MIRPSKNERLGRRLSDLVRARDGMMTSELVLHPGEHGLGMTHQSLRSDSTTVATCGYCATGCGLRLHLREGEAIGITPETSYPVNAGMACPKGWEALRVLDSKERATSPLLRSNEGQFHEVGWHEALVKFSQEFKAIQSKYGNESVAFLSTGQIACEEMALLGALAKFGMGMRHGDGNTRQCMATAVTAYKESFGFDAPPYTYDDFEQSDCLVFVGSNPCVAHPIMWQRVLRNDRNPHIIVIDPRRSETAMAATEHLQIRPKTDLAVLYAIAHQLIEDGFVDETFVENHTNGFAALKEHVSYFKPEMVAPHAGIEADQIVRVARTIGHSNAASFWWTMGVNQSHQGTRTAQAIINLALMTGNIGRPGTGANSITGQCNAMGSRLWSNTTNLLGHRRFESESDRRQVAEILGIPVESIPDQGSWSYDRIIEGIRNGEIRGLWVIATNPAHSWIDQGDVRELLDKLDFLVVQDMYHTTETARHADLVLPAAGWGEKDGTFINSERRYGRLKKVRRAPGQALADFQIFRAIAHYWGVEDMFAQWSDPEAVFAILQRLSADRPCDISGIRGYEHLDQCGGVQWPLTADQGLASPEPEKHRRLFADGQFYHEDGRARMIVDEISSPQEIPDEEFSLVLLTGRGTASQWHTQTRTSKSPVLRKLYPQHAYVEIHPEDSERLAIENGQMVRLRTRRGQADARACVTPAVAPGQVFMPMHYAETNRLTLRQFDPHSRQPSYKHCAVSVQALHAKRSPRHDTDSTEAYETSSNSQHAEALAVSESSST